MVVVGGGGGSVVVVGGGGGSVVVVGGGGTVVTGRGVEVVGGAAIPGCVLEVLERAPDGCAGAGEATRITRSSPSGIPLWER